MAAAAETATPVDTLSALTPLDGRYRTEIEPLVPYLSEEALIRKRIGIEAKYLTALSNVGIIRPLEENEVTLLENLETSLSSAEIAHVADIEKTKTKHDVKAVEVAMGEWFDGTPLAELTEWIHFGLTSEDVNNLARRLMLKEATEKVMSPQVQNVIDKIIDLADETKTIPMLARTHGQPAVPTTVGKELINFAVRLHGEKTKLDQVKLKGKLNGAVGNFNALQFAFPDKDWVGFSDTFIEDLGLEPILYTTQIAPYEDMTEMFQAYQRINGVIRDFDQDMWRYISDDWFAQKIEGVGSSTMPQKVNPIQFENSEGNAEMANGIFDVLIRELATSRLQRDLTDSTLIRNMGPALGHSLVAYTNTEKGLRKVYPHAEKMKEALTQNWAILSEAVQTYLRSKGFHQAYETLRKLTQGKEMDEASWKATLAQLPIEDKDREILLQVTPETYIGLAVELTEQAIKEIRGN